LDWIEAGDKKSAVRRSLCCLRGQGWVTAEARAAVKHPFFGYPSVFSSLYASSKERGGCLHAAAHLHTHGERERVI
jgi:hypothetical protein